MKSVKYIMFIICLLLFFSCQTKTKNTMDGKYGNDVNFLKEQKIDIIEMSDSSGLSKVLIVPAFQGRVMTSTAQGNVGKSFGWMNYKLIASQKWNNKFNPIGGEERFWFGPEGGPFSYYFKKGAKQNFENWNVPGVIDTDSFRLVSKSKEEVVFKKEAKLENASGTEFSIAIERSIRLLSKQNVESALKVVIAKDLAFVAYKSKNTITNTGNAAWNKITGMPSVWLLSMFNPGKSTTVFVPYQTNTEGKIVNDEYFGKVPANRLIKNEGIIYFNVDGKLRSKIGVPYSRAKNILGSYDEDNKVLTIVFFNLPTQEMEYVNSVWGEQEDSFTGDVINSYNDGPTDDGTIMGPFYEIETSSPAAELEPNKSLTHEQGIIHIQGNEEALNNITKTVFGVDLKTIKSIFK